MTGPKEDKRHKKSRKEAPNEGSAVPGVDFDQLERLLEFMTDHDLEEFEYEGTGLHIRLRKSLPAPKPPARPTPARQAPPAALDPAPAVAAHAQTVVPEPPTAELPAEELHIIKSPIVGTFYEASGPDAQPFVRVGDEVALGQVVCIIEAMKLMNEIEADAKGELVRVLVENAQPVEYGQPLFAIRTAAKKK